MKDTHLEVAHEHGVMAGTVEARLVRYYSIPFLVVPKLVVTSCEGDKETIYYLLAAPSMFLLLFFITTLPLYSVHLTLTNKLRPHTSAAANHSPQSLLSPT